MHSYDEPVYLISIVSKMLNIHPQTLRQYEKKNLIKPSRTEGKMRLYSKKNIDELNLIISLVKDFEVNLSGIEIILQLKQEIEQLQKEIVKLELKQGLSPKNKDVIIKKENRKIALIKYKKF